MYLQAIDIQLKFNLDADFHMKTEEIHQHPNNLPTTTIFYFL